MSVSFTTSAQCLLAVGFEHPLQTARVNEKNVELVLQNLKNLPKIDYHADEVLSVIAGRAPEAVIAFFCDRIHVDSELRARRTREFEASHMSFTELVKELPAGSPLRDQVVIALETTGVVSGEFGRAEAYERKRLEVLDWLTDPDERVRDFAKSYIEDLERMRDAEKERVQEEITLRKFRYGEPES